MPYTFEAPAGLVDALDEVQREELFDADTEASHVQAIFEQARTAGLKCSTREVLNIWLARNAQGQAVGMVLVTDEFVGRDQRWHKVANLYTHPKERGRGLGQTLIDKARAAYPDISVHYTADSIGLYERLGLPDFWRFSMNPGDKRALSGRHERMRQEHLHRRLEALSLAIPGPSFSNDWGPTFPGDAPSRMDKRGRPMRRR